MNDIRSQDAFLAKALEGHRELRCLLQAAEEKLAACRESETAPHQELIQSLEGLLTSLKKHFQEEEQGGLLDEAVSRLPRLGPKATSLEREHQPLLEKLCSVVHEARQALGPSDCWRIVEPEFRRFCELLRAHEAAESRLAEEAFNEELSGSV